MILSLRLLATMVLILVVALALVVILVGVLWSRLRTLARDVDRLKARETEARLLAIETRQELSGPDVVDPTAHENTSSIREPWASSRPVPIARRLDRAAASAVSGPTLITIPNLAPVRTEGGAPSSSELSQRFANVWELADAGAPPESIARETGHPIGQVELILALRRQVTANPGSRT